MKKCTRCNKEKEDKEFRTIKQRGKEVLNSYCKQCEKEYREEYKKTHKTQYVYRYNKYEGVEK